MNDKEKILLGLDRAADDLRRGWPVLLKNEADSVYAIMPLEVAHDANLKRFDALFPKKSEIVITCHRAATLKVAHKGNESVRLHRSRWLKAGDLVALADPTLDLSNPLMGPYQRSENDVLEVDQAAVQLVKHAHLLPALLVAKIACCLLYTSDAADE